MGISAAHVATGMFQEKDDSPKWCEGQGFGFQAPRWTALPWIDSLYSELLCDEIQAIIIKY